MLYIFYGTDTHTATRKAQALIEGLVAKRPDALVFRFEQDGVVGEIVGLIDAQGLFAPRHIVYARGAFENDELRDALLERAQALAQSENIFVLVESSLPHGIVRVLAPHAASMSEHSLPKQARDSGVFALADALCGRDKKALWVGYQRELRKGTSPESMHGTLHWAVRQMLLALYADTPEEAGQKPYLYQKYRRYAHAYAPGGVEALSHELVELVHESRRRSRELATELERWILAR